MRRPRSSVYLPSESITPQAIRQGLAWLGAAVGQARSKLKALVAVRAKAHLQSVLAGVLPGPKIKQFQKNEFVQVHGVPLYPMTLQLEKTYWDGPVLVVDPSARLLDAVDDLEAVPAVCVVSCNRAEVQGWIYRWNAGLLDPHHPLPSSNLPAFSNPVVETELRALTGQVNLQTGIIHPSDREAAIACFTALREARVRYKPLEIENWLITRGGWKVEDAVAVRKLAEAFQRWR
jgi:hypothetical protein